MGGIAPATGALFSSHGKQPIAAILIPRHIATTTTTWWGRRTLGVTIIIAETSAIITPTRLTTAEQLRVIDCVAAKCSRIVLRSSSSEKASLRHLSLRPQLFQPPLSLRQLLQARLLLRLPQLDLPQAVVKVCA